MPARDKIWAWCKERWEALFEHWPIYEGHHDVGPFNRSAALNTAARLADRDGRWDYAIVLDADVFLSPQWLHQAIAKAHDTGLVTWAFRRWRGMSREATERLLRPDPVYERSIFGAQGMLTHDLSGIDMDVFVEKTTPISWSCCFVFPRQTWDAIGGFDERFRGWGWEDMAMQRAIRGLFGAARIYEGDVYHWWHPRSVERDPEKGEYRPEFEANKVLGRMYMDADNDVDPRTKINDQMRHVPAYWTDKDRLWELVNAKKEGTSMAPHTVTVAVHTDGRKEFIERSIDSLESRMKARQGMVTRRIIFDDSGDRSYKDWCNQRFASFGYYVVGPNERLGYTRSMAALWRYLDRRCDSEYVFLVEDDFKYLKNFSLEKMIVHLEEKPYVRQVALLRKPYYPKELEAGGIIQQNPDAFEVKDGLVEHRDHFTANPSLIRRGLAKVPWPLRSSSERHFSNALLHDPEARFAYLGDGKPWIEHIGEYRVGKDY